MSIKDIFLKFFSNSYDNNNDIKDTQDNKDIKSKPTYEDSLLKLYGIIDNPNTKLNIRIMFIADTHDTLYYHKEMQEFIKNEPNVDVYILLGDHSAWECDFFKENIPNDKLFGIVGNHDPWNRLTDSGITDINKKVININGIKIAGLAGSTKYKEGNYGMYSQEEALEIAENLEKADILITHDKPYLEEENDYVHNGLKGITYYIYKNKVPYHFHGHLHFESERILKNGTKSQCIYKIKVLEL